MGQFGGKRLCGNLTGYNFLNSKRVDFVTNECPQGFRPCNPNASPDNIICMEESANENLETKAKQGTSFFSRCPINEIQIRAKTSVPDWKSEVVDRDIDFDKGTDHWMSLELSDNLIIRY